MKRCLLTALLLAGMLAPLADAHGATTALEIAEPGTATAPAAPDYAKDAAWAALPWTADGADRAPAGLEDLQAAAAADVFFVHPTSGVAPDALTGAFEDPAIARQIDDGALAGQASLFNGCCRIFAPRYRQAGRLAFDPRSGAAGREARRLAFEDVRRAFLHYLDRHNNGRPFILAGHSQGSFHILALLADLGARPGPRERLIAAYAIGWPVVLRLYDIELAPFRPCTAPGETGCIVSFSTFGRDAQGRPEPPAAWSGEGLQCTNPLSLRAGTGRTDKRFNQGSLLREGASLALRPGLIDAECRQGALWAAVPGTSPWAARKLPPNSYHLLDYALYYANLREDARARVRGFFAAGGAASAPAGVRKSVP